MHKYQDEWFFFLFCFSSCWIDWTFIHFVLFWNFFYKFLFKNKFTWTDEMYQEKFLFLQWFFVWTWKKLKNTNLYIPEQTIRDIGNKNQTMVEEYLHTQTDTRTFFFVYKTVDKFVETLDLNNNKKNLADDNKWIDDGNYVVNL